MFVEYAAVVEDVTADVVARKEDADVLEVGFVVVVVVVVVVVLTAIVVAMEVS
ncbi:hypothetical protein LRQ08_11900 [Rhodococcus qingshengii]|uniref:hypothetical protein n=1 Tax=Rhodococcus qingshengii TaxID=334542 RepID=UPI002111155C|nr:hypothetical protein [Rhodococcus qingshengii]UUE27506.1 hypothetical protein LRQ08_11900 [Rhodococcus qingshengii]